LGALEYEPGIESHEAGQAIIELSEMRKSAIGIISGTAAEVSNGLFKQGGLLEECVQNLCFCIIRQITSSITESDLKTIIN
jgi:hypothetical protein